MQLPKSPQRSFAKDSPAGPGAASGKICMNAERS